MASAARNRKLIPSSSVLAMLQGQSKKRVASSAFWKIHAIAELRGRMCSTLVAFIWFGLNQRYGFCYAKKLSRLFDRVPLHKEF